jgi:hypothetical protein
MTDLKDKILVILFDHQGVITNDELSHKLKTYEEKDWLASVNSLLEDSRLALFQNQAGDITYKLVSE